jgi:hypothetical protein
MYERGTKMAIRIGGTVVIDDTKNITNILNMAASSGQITGSNGLYVSSGGISVGSASTASPGVIQATGDVVTAFSDQRLKTDIQNISNALDKVNQIRGVYYRPNDIALKMGYPDDRRRVGVLAQEIEKILPEVVVRAPVDIKRDAEGKEVSISGYDYKTVQYEKLVPLLIEAIKELSNQVEHLKKLY